MGFQDRDYVREKHRRGFDDMMVDNRRPFTPPQRDPSVLFMVLVWLAIGAVLYVGFKWWVQPQRKAESSNSVPMTVRPVQEPIAERRQPVSVESPPLMASPVASVAAPNKRQVDPSYAAPVATQPEAHATAGTIYLCKAYNGGTFWSQAHCNQHQALIDSMVSVPPGMPFHQQVELAQQRRQALAQTIYAAPAAPAPAVVSNKAECEALDRQVQNLDDMARQPQSAQTQDWIRGQRQKARDRQFHIRC